MKLEVTPARIAIGQWAVKASHLVGYDEVLPTEEAAQSVASFTSKCIESARAKDEARIKELEEALSAMANWLEIPQMGTWQYMEGEGFYSDKHKHITMARAILNKRPA